MYGKKSFHIALIALLAIFMFCNKVLAMGGMKGLSGAALIAALLGGHGHHGGHRFLPIPIPIPIYSDHGHDETNFIPYFGGHHAHDYGHIDHGHQHGHGW